MTEIGEVLLKWLRRAYLRTRKDILLGVALKTVIDGEYQAWNNGERVLLCMNTAGKNAAIAVSVATTTLDRIDD